MSAVATRENVSGQSGSGFWPLLKLTVNNTFGLSAARHRYLVEKKHLWEPILIVVAILWAGAFFEFLLYQMAKGFVAAGLGIGQPQIVFTFAFLVASMLVLFFGVMAIVSVFYFSTDLGLLVPLPLRPGAVVLAKFGAVALGEYIGILVAMAPAAVAYAQAVGGGLVYWLAVVLVVLLAPVIPLAIAAIFSIGVMRVINRRHRDLLLVAFSVALMVAMLGFQMSLMNNLAVQGDPAEYLRRVLAGQLDLVALLGRAFPPAIWATNLIAGATAGARSAALGLYVGVSALAVWLIGGVGNRFFYAGLVGGSELARRRLTAQQRAAARAATQARTVRSSELRALVLREWHLFMRVPIYVMNGFAATLIVPVLFIFGFRGVMKDPDMVRIVNSINATGNAAFFGALAVAALAVLLVALNTTASTAISREGRYLWISKIIPVSAEKQVQGKMLFAGLAAIVSALPVLGIFAVVMKMTVAHFAGALVLTALGSMLFIFVGLLVDLCHPYLKWTNPQQAVKSNLNVIAPMPVAIAVVAGLTFLARWLYSGLGLSEPAVMLALAGVLALLAVPAYRLTVSAGKRLYERLEA